MNKEDLKADLVVTGPVFPEPVKIITVTPMGDSVRLIGQGLKSNQVHQPILTPDQILLLEASPDLRPTTATPKESSWELRLYAWA